MYLSVRHGGTLSSEFNDTERDINKLASQTSKEATWRNHLARYAASGKSIAAFCRDEGISAANFYVWRARFADGGIGHASRPTPQSEFIDLGAVNSTVQSRAMEHSPVSAPAALELSCIDLRIDLGGGVVLTITRR